MSRVTLENAVVAWLVAATTKKVIIFWPGKPRPIERPYLTVKVASIFPFGMDEELELSSAGVQRYKGTKIATIELGAYGAGALDALGDVAKGVYKESTRDLLSAAYLYPQPPGPVLDLTQMLETEPEERGSLELKIAFAEEYYDTVGLIEHVEGTGKFYLPDETTYKNVTYQADIPTA
jgi:hypothetical protein